MINNTRQINNEILANKILSKSMVMPEKMITKNEYQ